MKFLCGGQRVKEVLRLGLRMGVMGLGALVASVSAGSPILFDSAAELLTEQPDLQFESFELLKKDNRSSRRSSISVPGFDVVASAKKLGVYDRKSAGQGPVDGRQYVKYSPESGGSSLTFNFTSPINIFGISVIDWGERGAGALSVVASGFGAVHGLQTPQLDGGIAFLGVKLLSPVPWVQLSHDLSGESWAFDGVYFGRGSDDALTSVSSQANLALGHSGISASLPGSSAASVSEPGALFVVGLMCLGLRRMMR